MRTSRLLLALLFLFAASLSATTAYADGRPDFTQLDGVPLDGSEDAVLTAFEQLKAAQPSPSPSPTRRTSLFGNGDCVGLQCLIQKQNPNPSLAAQRFAAENERMRNAGLSPIQIRAQPFDPQHVYCSQPKSGRSYATFDTQLDMSDRSRIVFAKFKETDPNVPCQSSATILLTSQASLVSTVEAINAVEDEFVKATREKFGTPTYFSPRHIGDVVNQHTGENLLGTFNNIIGAGNNAPQAPTVEKRTIPPFAAWCDTGTVSDCKGGGPSVNRKLTLGFGFTEGYIEAEIQLEDLQEERRIKATFTNADVQQVKPQL